MAIDFDANVHGFKFRNYFDFSENIELSMAPFLKVFGVENFDLGRIIYGLCGGMCFGALDHFYAIQKIPDYTDRPGPNKYTPLYSYLVQRQMDSLSISTLRKLFRWLMRKSDEVQKLAFRNEFPKMRRLLRRKEPVVLVLMRGEDFSDATKNHQVIATNYSQSFFNRQVTIDLYDPNHPGKRL